MAEQHKTEAATGSNLNQNKLEGKGEKGKGKGKGKKMSGSEGFKQPRKELDEGFKGGPVCLMSLTGDCPQQGNIGCKHGQHVRQTTLHEVPGPNEVLVHITRAKMQLLQARWSDAGGHGQLQGAWQIRNKRLDQLFRASAHNFTCELGKSSDMIDGWHGSAEENILSIARYGFDPSRRAGQAYGAGEYFAKDPCVSVSYAKGGSFMFLCKLLLGTQDVDHTWVDSAKYYVVKQQSGLMQALPVYVVQFKGSKSKLCHELHSLKQHEHEDEGTLRHRQRGGQTACVARKDAGMTADSTQYIWLGWLSPELSRSNDDDIADDVSEFLRDLTVAEVIPERNGARVGAFVRLQEPIGAEKFQELSQRKYHGQFTISVDDQQPGNPRCLGKPCPRLTGPSRYCRGWNIRGHHAWQWGCPFDHPLHLRPTDRASFTLEEVQINSAKYDEIKTALEHSAPFHNGMPVLVSVSRVVNRALEEMYEKRRNFLTDKHGFALEKELWHGTNCKALPDLLTHGLQPPSDTEASDDCPVSGRKGLSTTLCSSSCKHCNKPHVWNRCHMYGHGIYLADLAQKSHRYVREPEHKKVRSCCANYGVGAFIYGMNGEYWGWVVAEEEEAWRLDSGRIAKMENEGIKWYFVPSGASEGLGANIQGIDGSVWGRVVWEEGDCYHLESGRIAKKATNGNKWTWIRQDVLCDVYSMLWCRVCLGSPYLIEGNLLSQSAMHDFCWCQDPSDKLETTSEDWNMSHGHDTYYVRGLGGTQRAGLGVHNSEYIVFQPYQVLPLYRVDYTLQ